MAGPLDEFKPAVEVLDDRRAGVHPVAAVRISQTVDFGDFRPVNVATYDSVDACLLYTSPSPRDRTRSRMPSSA